MKKIVLISIALMITMVTPALGYSPSFSNGDVISIQDGFSNLELTQSSPANERTPFLYDIVWENNTVITPYRQRNDTLGEGAIYKVDPYDKIKFRYAVALNNYSDFVETQFEDLLFADIPYVNGTNFNNTQSLIDLGLSSDMTLTNEATAMNFTFLPNLNQTNLIDFHYPFSSTVLPNATLYVFETTLALNVSVNYVPFYVYDKFNGLSEIDNNKPYNLITSAMTYNTSTSDEFYIQNEVANITATVTGRTQFDPLGQSGFGIGYRVNITNYKFVNFTLTPDGSEYNGTEGFGPYNPSTTLDWYSIYYIANDTMINQSRFFTRVDIKDTSFGDGNPVLEAHVFSDHPYYYIKDKKLYSQNSTIKFTTTVSVPKGNLTGVYLVPNDGETPIEFPAVNGTIEGRQLSMYYNYSQLLPSPDFGSFNATVWTVTDKGLNVSDTFSVTIDTNDPSGQFIILDAKDNVITTTDGYASFSFSFSDPGSGVLRAILDFGDDTSAEVTNLSQITHRYQNFDNEAYTITLTVVDYAGNTIDTTLILTLKTSDIGPTSPNSIGGLIFIVLAIALLLSPIWATPVFEFIRNKF